MTRKVICLLENKTVDASDCDPNLVPFSSDPCNNHPCGLGNILMKISSILLKEFAMCIRNGLNLMLLVTKHKIIIVICR